MAALGRYAPLLAVMALIYFLSSRPSLSTGLGTYDLILRKLAHMTEFGVLWLLSHRALGWRAPAAAAVLTVAYAASDELHQTFVFGRHGTPVDVLIDATGVGLAYLALRASRARWR